MTFDKKIVEQAAEAYGFNLEFKAKRILEDKKFVVENNKYFHTNDIEVDLYATKHLGEEFLIECKGTTADSCLILVKEVKNEKTSSLYRRCEIEGSNYRLAQFKSKDEFFTFTGDFFNQKSNKLTKISKNDEENNFYKAQQQIMLAITAFLQAGLEKDEDYPHIIPIIITNADIWVVDYEHQEPMVKNYKWILHKVKTTKELILERAGKNTHVFLVPIINIKYLDEFLPQNDKLNVDGLIQLPSGVINN